MSIKELLEKYSKIEIELLLSHMLKKPKEFLFLHPDLELSAVHYTSVMNLIRKRLKGEPVAYVLGYKDFYGLRFKVNRNVLIPRPETELVVEKVVRDVVQGLAMPSKQAKGPHYNRSIKILDLGTGSGCIIIAIAKQLQNFQFPISNFQFFGSDISQKALKVAKANAKAHKVKIQYIHSNILQNVGMSFDVIIANLPYGWQAWKNNTSVESKGLKFEPQEALFTKEKGLYLYRKLLTQIAALKNKPKLIYLEFDPRQKKDLQKLITKNLPKAEMKFHKDFNSLRRYAEIIPESVF